MSRNGIRYASLYERLVANTHEPENDQACWLWAGNTDAKGYGRLTVRKGGKHTKVRAHRAMCECILGRPLEPNEEPDHVCVNTGCINPDHLDAVSRQVNIKRRDERRALRVSTYA